eukprot:SM000361S13809  [mRNA]  locus=s361:18985:21699:- [translate_table: standard]
MRFLEDDPAPPDPAPHSAAAAAAAAAAASLPEDDDGGDQHLLPLHFLKAQIVSHALYGQLVEAHVACLKVATPVDQLPQLDEQLSQADGVVEKYMFLLPPGGSHELLLDEQTDLDWFMAQMVVLLQSFKEELEQHVRVHAREAVLACWELEQSLVSITGTTHPIIHLQGAACGWAGVEAGPGTGATMSDEDMVDDGPFELHMHASSSGERPMEEQALAQQPSLLRSDSEQNLMERMRQELKQQLKQGYRARIEDVREEIMRKRRAGKLPGDTTQVLKDWWNSHAKWPYPTEDEKAILVQQTGLELKQINNWFINQRKRNWHNSSSSKSEAKTSAKRLKAKYGSRVGKASQVGCIPPVKLYRYPLASSGSRQGDTELNNRHRAGHS